MRIRIANSPREFDCGPGESLLDAALGAGFNLPHSCRGGNCGACRALRVTGELHYPNGTPLGLSAAEAAEGYVLLCQARPRSDLLLALDTVQRADQLEVRRLPCRIERLERLAHDVMGVWLRLPAAEPLAFRAGQYLDVLLPQARRRSFSVASPPHDARLLELHVRRVAGGLFSERLFAASGPGGLLEIEAPLGAFHYLESDPRRPLLLIGGGTGLAPLLSIARHVVEQGIDREVHLYWGVRTERDLYALGPLEALARCSPRFVYQTVLSEPSVGWTGQAGWVHEVALESLGTRAFEVYAAGPPAMIVALRGAALACGLPPERLHVDVFDYASDGPRTSSSAASMS